MPRGDCVTHFNTDVWTYKFPCEKIITAENDRTLHLKKKLHSKKCGYCCKNFKNVNDYETLEYKTKSNFQSLNTPRLHQEIVTTLLMDKS